MATGLFTLGGVIVGGLLNYVVTAAIEEKRGRRALRTTARVVAGELGANAAVLKTTLDAGEWLAKGNTPLQVGAWEHHRHVLAERLSLGDWQRLREAIGGIRMIERQHTSGDHDRPVSTVEAGHLRDVGAAAQNAVEMLDRHS